jgi:PPOX class F420-dependent enzyme/OxyR family protein
MNRRGLSGDLQQYLQQAREALVGALGGLGEYDARRPCTPSGTNILGLVKHLVGIESSYLGDCVGRPSPLRLPWVEDGSIWDGADMWAGAEETREYILDLYRAAWSHSDASILELPLDTPAHVEWWPAERRATTLGHLAVRVVAETAQHAGHADILRESIDGRGGRDHDEIGDDIWWNAQLDRIRAAADVHRGGRPPDGGGTSMSFSDDEVAYLQSQPLARLATRSADGQPDVVPVSFEFDGTSFWVGGPGSAVLATRKFRNIGAGSEQVAMVVDDMVSFEPFIARGIRIYGRAEQPFERVGLVGPGIYLRITPTISWSWNMAGEPVGDTWYEARRTVHNGR